MKVAIAGASGFIGHYLIEDLLEKTDFEIVALSRSFKESRSDRLKFVQADLYSMLDCENALKDCDSAVYLVHSMLPSSRLAQGNFQDFDFILADNFVKAAEKMNVKQIVYVSGIIPPKENLSIHLASRLEVEETLDQNDVGLLTLRCGLVVGDKGSSFQIVERLVERLPVLGLPSWTRNKLQIVFVKDLVGGIRNGLKKNIKGCFDVGSPREIDYKYILKKVAEIKNSKNVFINIPLISPRLSKLWVLLITGLSGRLIFPLIDSLIHNMVVNSKRKIPSTLVEEYTPVDEALERSLKEDAFPKLPLKDREKRKNNEMVSLVQSVQRLPCPEGWSSKDVALAYMDWLPQFLFPVFNIQKQDRLLQFKILAFKKPLLVLNYSEERTFEGRDLFYIEEGLLVNKQKSARFEFRRGPQEGFVIAAIHNFRPSLPWFVYRFTQAKIHAFVMWRFGRWLRKQ